MGTIYKGRGRFVWFDLNTTDPAAARAFYAKVIGWGDQLFGEDYHMFMAQGEGIGGSVELTADAKAMGAPPHWLGYIGTPDVDATTKQAVGLGATLILPPMDIPTIGRFAILLDPQGAVFAPFTSLTDPPGNEGAARQGEVGWHELHTTDPKAAVAFYGELFGWTQSEAFDMGPERGLYHLFKRPGAQNNTGGIQLKMPQVPMSNWLFYIQVDSVAKAAETIAANGGTVVFGPHEVPGGDLIVMAMDPQGAAFAVLQSVPQAAQG